MTLGPLEYLVVGFQGNRFDGSIASELAKVVENKTIRIVDAVVIAKGASGDAAVLELDNTDDPRFASFAPLLEGLMGLFTPEDVAQIAADLPADTSAMALLFEHHWAVDVKEAMARAGGFLVTREIIPPEVLEAVNAELEAATGAA